MKEVICGQFDMNDKHPSLFGDCILVRDDDGMGFHLIDSCKKFIGKDVIITIELDPIQRKSYWVGRP